MQRISISLGKFKSSRNTLISLNLLHIHNWINLNNSIYSTHAHTVIMQCSNEKTDHVVSLNGIEIQ